MKCFLSLAETLQTEMDNAWFLTVKYTQFVNDKYAMPLSIFLSFSYVIIDDIHYNCFRKTLIIIKYTKNVVLQDGSM